MGARDHIEEFWKPISRRVAVKGEAGWTQVSNSGTPESSAQTATRALWAAHGLFADLSAERIVEGIAKCVCRICASGACAGACAGALMCVMRAKV
ncbi:hypothetical protein ANO11243_050800 [Dothideomycetidae sp. 11243]|nr:hypothetical protein ANO11243_050800 [fungal sp. No.11243]